MAKAKKFYAVGVGRKAGVYDTWAEAEKQVKGFAGAKFKGFPTRAEAEAFCQNPVYGAGTKKKGPATKSSQADLPTTGRSDQIIVYTDGGCSGNPGPGGYGAVILNGQERMELSGGYQLTTNNRMEMMACIVALEKVVDLGKPIHVYSDSSYMINGLSKGWAAGWRRRGWKKSGGEPAVNPDLWQRLLDLYEKLSVELTWVKGHAGHELNERCDRLAVSAGAGSDLMEDKGYRAS